jgi:hypothetical protein
MAFQTGLPSKVFVGAPDPLQGHPPVQQGFHHFQRHEVSERVQAGDARPPAGLLHGRCHQSDLIPVPQLTRSAAGQATSLM